MLKPRLTASATLHLGSLATTTLVSTSGASAVLRKPLGLLSIRAAQGAVRAQLAPFFIGPKGDSGTWGNAHLVWADGLLVGVEYAGGQTKTLQWAGGRVQWVDVFYGVETTRKTLVWDGAGRLVDVVVGGA